MGRDTKYCGQWRWWHYYAFEPSSFLVIYSRSKKKNVHFEIRVGNGGSNTGDIIKASEVVLKPRRLVPKTRIFLIPRHLGPESAFLLVLIPEVIPVESREDNHDNREYEKSDGGFGISRGGTQSAQEPRREDSSRVGQDKTNRDGCRPPCVWCSIIGEPGG